MAVSEFQKPLGSGFGAKTEPSEIMGDLNLTGAVAVVTGGYSGIGLETTRALAGAGAHVIVPVRTPEKAEAALAPLSGKIETTTLDLGDLSSVRRFTDEFASAHKRLHLLINNAGIMACPETKIGPGAASGKGWEAQFATNHLGHAALFDGLLSALQNAGGARVVSLSSTGHKRSPMRFDDIHFEKEPYEKWTAYGQSKTANSLFAVGVDARYKDDGIRAYAVHPGGIMTPLQRHLRNEEMVALGWIDESGEISEMAKPFFKTPAQGATTSLWCAVSPQLAGVGGVYCQDCDIADIDDGSFNRAKDVQPYAVDTDEADRLWDVTAGILSNA